jgi:chemotaxis protein histidine kinase CheA
MSLSPEERRARMETLRRRFLDQLPRMTRDALSAFERCTLQPPSDGAFNEARRHLHTMAGTLGTFGFLRLVEDIRLLERLLATSPGGLDPLPSKHLLASVRSQVDELCGRPAPPESQGEAS